MGDHESRLGDRQGMKVLEVVNVDFSLRHFVWPLMRGLRAAGHEVIGACAEGPLLGDVRADGFDVRDVPMARSFNPVAQWRAFCALRQLIREVRPDLVHAHMPISGFLARLAARIERVPRVAYTCHGFLFNQTGPAWKRGVSLAMEWIGGRMTDVFLAVNGAEAADARRLGIHRDAIAIGNGRDPAMFRPDPDARHRVRAKLGTPQDAVVITIVSRLVRAKGHPELLEAMQHVPGAVLWVVGERLPTDHDADLEPYFQAANLGERLVRLGYRADIPAILAATDIFVLPSHFEAMPMSVIEAMLTGLPVVATDTRGPREQVIAEQTGLLVPPREPAPLAAALNRLVADPGLRARMGAAGLVRAQEKFNEARIVARTIALLTGDDARS